MSETFPCSTNGCEKKGNLKCPTCIKMNLPVAYFCSQECFKGFWPVHKVTHMVGGLQLGPPTQDPRFKGFSRYTGALRPSEVTARRAVPDSIPFPDYGKDPNGTPKSENAERGSTRIEAWSSVEDLSKAREAGRLARRMLDLAGSMVAPGVTCDAIDAAVHAACVEAGCYPSPLNYRGFPKSCCTSVNEVICHGIPDLRPLQEGDIVNVDITIFYQGWHSDLNETFFVGLPSERAVKLVKCAWDCLYNAIRQVRPGNMYRNLGQVIAKTARAAGCSVVKSYVGHGCHHLFHTAPNVPHYHPNKAIGIMRPGHIFTIEPMINEGAWEDELWPDDWTAVTADGKWSAQFELTLLVTEDGYEILNGRTDKSFAYPWDTKFPLKAAVKPPQEPTTGNKNNKKKRR